MPRSLNLKSIPLPKFQGAAGLFSTLPRLHRALDWLGSPKGVAAGINFVSLILAAYLFLLAGEALLKAEIFQTPTTDLTSLEGESDTKGKKPFESYQIILSRNLFGTTAPVAAPTPAPNAAAKPKLRLVGTNASKGSGAFAIIEDQNKNEQDVFSIKEQVFQYGKLVEINNESVKLEYADRTDTLEIEEGKAPPSTSPLGEEPAPANDDQSEFTVSEAELNDALGNLPLLLSQARAVPYFRNGQSIGMRLFAIRSGSLYEKLGLQNGDIITAVNESSLSDPTQALRLFEQLKNERNIGVKMERNGAQRESRYSIR